MNYLEKIEDFNINKKYKSLFDIGKYVKDNKQDALKPKREIVNTEKQLPNLQLIKKELEIKLNFTIKGYESKMITKKKFDEIVLEIKKEIRSINKKIKKIN